MINSQDEHFQTISKHMTEALEELRSELGHQDYLDVKEYIDYGEYGVAWELLWHIVKHEGLVIPSGLLLSGRMMGLNNP